MDIKNKTIGIVGCGIIGGSWARAFLTNGYDVVIHDPGADAETLRQRLQRHAKSSTQITIASELGQLSHCGYVQESTPEDKAFKIAIFEKLDTILPADTVVGSSTSALCMSDLVNNLSGRDRFIVVHPASPPHALPAVEIVPAPFTSIETIEFSEALLRAIGQTPVRLNREVPGFVLNRLQGALLLAMVDVVREGIVSPEGVDALLRDSFGMRWALVGPFEGVHLNAPGGIADYFTRYSAMFDAFCPDGVALNDVLSAETLGKLESYALSSCPLENAEARRAWRDDALLALREWRAGVQP